jgi:DNA-binding LacI/PurR family transcriptional regulator
VTHAIDTCTKMSRIQKVSIRDLARETGFSPMTVSRALRNSGKVNPETKATIRDLADKLGYRQNPLVSANMAGIRASKSVTYQATIGIIHETPKGGEWMGTKKLLDATISTAESLGFKTDLFDLANPKVTTHNLSRMLTSRGIQGVIQVPMIRDFADIPLDFSHFTIVACSSGSLPQKFHRVCPDHYGNMDMLLKHIRSLGYKRVGLMIAKDLDIHLNHLSSSRFLAFQQTESIPKIPIFMPDGREDYSPERFRIWFKKHRPEIVITTCETIFRNHFFQDAGLGIPNDLAVVKVNINRTRKYFSGISEESAEVGSTAVNTLAQLLFQNEKGLPEKPMSVLIPGKWIDAGTVPELV